MVGKGRKRRRPFRAPAVLLIASGLVLLAAAVSLGQEGPDIANVQFAVDSSGAAPPPPAPPAPAPAPVPPAAAPGPVTPPTVKIRGNRRTKAKRPVFTIGMPGATGVTYICKVGMRESTKITPCASPFRVPNLGPGRHVLVVQTVDAAGNASAWVKYPYFVAAR